jgi:hypothetical protein
MKNETIISYRFILLILTSIIMIPTTYFVITLFLDSPVFFEKFIMYTIIVVVSLDLIVQFFLLFGWPILYTFRDEEFCIYYIGRLFIPMRFKYSDIEGIYYRKVSSEFKGPNNIIIRTHDLTHQVGFIPGKIIKIFKERISSDLIRKVDRTQYFDMVKYKKILTDHKEETKVRKKQDPKFIKDYKKFYKRLMIIGIIMIIPGTVALYGIQNNPKGFLAILTIIGVIVFLIGDVFFVIGMIKLITKNDRILPNFEDLKDQFKEGN